MGSGAGSPDEPFSDLTGKVLCCDLHHGHCQSLARNHRTKPVHELENWYKGSENITIGFWKHSEEHSDCIAFFTVFLRKFSNFKISQAPKSAAACDV
jgi:hypothetical protein